jgi:hypothetical protein
MYISRKDQIFMVRAQTRCGRLSTGNASGGKISCNVDLGQSLRIRNTRQREKFDASRTLETKTAVGQHKSTVKVDARIRDTAQHNGPVLPI